MFLAALALCVFASEESYSSGASVFEPASLPCKFKLHFTKTENTLLHSAPIVTKGWIAMFGKHFSRYQSSDYLESFEVIRADISDPNVPNTGAAYHLFNGMDMYTCELEYYKSKDDLYSGMDDEYKYFVNPFAYNTMNEDDEWGGVKCRSFAFAQPFWDKSTTLYVNDEDHVIGVVAVDDSNNVTINVDRFDDNVLLNDFKMPKENECQGDARMFTNPPKEDNCDYPEKPQAFQHKLPCLFKVYYTENTTEERPSPEEEISDGWIAMYGRYLSHYVDTEESKGVK